MVIRKDLESHDFGFSISDGLLEKGVYVNMIRPDGPADKAGLKSFDRILQVCFMSTKAYTKIQRFEKFRLAINQAIIKFCLI